MIEKKREGKGKGRGGRKRGEVDLEHIQSTGACPPKGKFSKASGGHCVVQVVDSPLASLGANPHAGFASLIPPCIAHSTLFMYGANP